jgi:methyl-accepting chemotaxis protein
VDVARSFRRKNYLIKRKFQFNFLSRFVVLLLGGSLAVAGIFMYISSNTITTGYSNSTLKVQSTPAFFFASLLFITVVVAVVIGTLGVIAFIFLSHRIAGPLYRFEKTLGDISSGNLTSRINLRKTDQLVELKEAFNILLDSLDSRMGKAGETLNEMQDLLSGKVDAETVSKLKRMAGLLKAEIGHFKVTGSSKG